VMHSVPVTLIVSSSPDFFISVTPPSQVGFPSTSRSYPIAVTASAGFSGAINLTATGLPPAAVSSLTQVSINGSGSSTLNITLAPSTPAGSYPLSVTGVSGSTSHTTSAMLIVDGPVPAPWSDRDIGGVGLTGVAGYDAPSASLAVQ